MAQWANLVNVFNAEFITEEFISKNFFLNLFSWAHNYSEHPSPHRGTGHGTEVSAEEKPPQRCSGSGCFCQLRDYHLSLVQGAFTYLRWHWKVKSPVAHTTSLVCVDYSKGPSRLASPPHGQLMNGLHSLRPLPPLLVPWDTFGEGGCSAHIINLFVFFRIALVSHTNVHC